jgi:hypothetical protein
MEFLRILRAALAECYVTRRPAREAGERKDKQEFRGD